MYQRSDAMAGVAGGAAMFSLDRAVQRPRATFGRAETAIALTDDSAGGWAGTWRHFLDDLDLTCDLGADIGSRVWWRGLATLLTLLAFTWMLAPGMPHLVEPGVPVVSGNAWDETRAQSIAPLAWGGDTGRRMAATDAVVPLTDAPERPQLMLTAMVGQGDSFTRALERAGVSSNDAVKIADLTGTVINPADISEGTILSIVLGKRTAQASSRPLETLAFRARFDAKLAFVRNGNGFSMQRTMIAVDNAPLRISGRAGGGIFLAATAAGAPPEAVQTYIRAIAEKEQLSDLSNDATYDMVIERQRAATGEVRFGKLLYAGLNTGGKSLKMIEWTIDGRTEWYDEAGVGERRGGGFVVPVQGAHLTSSFGMRFHPILGYSRMHQGTDYGAVYGTPIHAVSDGVVEFAGWHGGHGNMVKLAHAGGLGSGYAHMSRIAVSPGMRVHQGDVIGYVGSTGLSTGPHLHFEIYRGGVPVNPGSVNFAASTSLLSGPALAAFRSRLQAITSVGITGTLSRASASAAPVSPLAPHRGSVL